MKENKFLVMWNAYGLEAVVDITEFEHPSKEELADMIKAGNDEAMNRKTDYVNHILNGMLIRAKFNNDRSFEVYGFRTSDGLTKKDIENLFEENPQFIVEFIRKNGACFWKKSSPSQTQKIF
jgi:hypothetical protein